MSFGTDTRDHDAFVKGEWWGHEWEMTKDPKYTYLSAVIEIANMRYGDTQMITDNSKAKVLVSSTN